VSQTDAQRRPLKSRGTKWAQTTASWLLKRGVRPNQVSLASIVFGGWAGLFLVMTGPFFLSDPMMICVCCLAAAVCIQMRLLCNLFDGMIAVEGGLKSKSGEIYNELPDRISDTFILLGAGYSLYSIEYLTELGWLAALLALMTAYIRVLGAAVGAGHDFRGPMAKQQRMAVMTASCLLSGVAAFWKFNALVIGTALAIIALGSLITCIRRTVHIVQTLEARP